MKTKDQVNTMTDILINIFEIESDEAPKMAEKMIAYLENKASTWINTTTGELPEAQDLGTPANTYYTIKVENFGERQAMYLFDETGEKGWYSSYVDKIIRRVTHYQPQFKLV
jgi:hypothetical protein